ncbi:MULTISPECIES: TrmB family transcriptional regulator [unclassified Paenibacillus]|uniref:TrmB family transcriptional regulator n=1 Tax=unclassified Paenibacillus TaxID=185978 RepID=UPI0024068AAE|nr:MULTISPECIES: TrmB family transcriptional regulator [unclassified Paenibacillus]MDF9843404.1 DNA-binding transcriptional ArsR family regulator [Paenibacillus sp. PastF-2]MDF9849991.1 DNA-binding transcriptional ArsR family regulator [Paenibacillus sp. PastM-2]MDF9856699.1 DNA-binding transcriptional ArsR family regulator [Paenibacillus sp. PastF-1]MDH6481970.1 DNA-binding transcriptional ArsR family regulator [Paenibacillus sp. PastH-2]MDH6509394.1 DNA-binding transcriptional ArsR family re
MEQLLLHLRNLGFTEMESKIMVELATKGEASGYEVAKQLGVSRSNVYAALQRLTQQGYVRCGEGEPARYSVLDPEELATMISGRVQASLAFVESEMPRGGPVSQSFYNIEGDRNMLGALTRQLNLAEKEIVVDVWREEASLLRSELEQAERRGVKLLWAFDGGNTAAAPYPVWPPLGGKPRRSGGRKFSFVIDRSWCMLGMRYEDGTAQAVVTEHEVLVELLLNHFSQEMVLFELEEDMGAELTRRYGDRYSRIYSKYVMHEKDHDTDMESDPEDSGDSRKE